MALLQQQEELSVALSPIHKQSEHFMRNFCQMGHICKKEGMKYLAKEVPLQGTMDKMVNTLSNDDHICWSLVGKGTYGAVWAKD